MQRAWPGLRHGFSFGWPRLDDADLRLALAETAGSDAESTWIFDQPHGREILDLGSGVAHEPAPAAALPVTVSGYDGATASAGGGAPAGTGTTLVVKAADCVSVLAVLPQHGLYAALHAGWRGTAAGILPRLLSLWQAQVGSLDDARLAFGPHIRACCFEVKADCIACFPEEDLRDAVAIRNGRTYIDLERVLRTQAAVFGLGDAQIEALPQCTYCSRDASGAFPFASYRRSQREGQFARRNIAFIGPAR